MKYLYAGCFWSLLVATIFFSGTLLFAQDIVLDTYEKGLRKQWEPKSFKGKTKYEVTTEDGIRCIKAVSKSSASALDNTGEETTAWYGPIILRARH